MKVSYPKRKFGVLLGAVAIVLAVACGSAVPSTTAPEVPLKWLTANDDSDEIMAILATTLLDVGPQRLAFLLSTPDELIKGANVLVTPVYVADNAAGATQGTEFHLWPYGIRGVYTTEVTFDRPGQWRLDIEVDGARTHATLEIRESPLLPALGEIAPLSKNKTLDTVASIEKLTTDYTPDPDLYRVTIEKAVESPLPAVVVFASPAFCTSPTCGPQVDTVSKLKDIHLGEANFIHVEIYDNPDEIQGDLDRAVIARPVDEWGLTSIPHWFNESWTFVLDPEGRIQARFEGFATLEELETSLKAVLAGT